MTIKSISRVNNPILMFGLAFVMAISCITAAELTVDRHFSDNMVLQREKPVSIYGSADINAEISVSFMGQNKMAKTDKNGVWSVTLKPMSASSKGRELKCQIKGKSDNVVLNNVVVGDVLLLARQTSINVSLGKDAEGIKVASAHKNNPLFRVISIKTIPAAKPQNDLSKEATSGWTEVNRESALKMAVSAYYLGRDLVAKSDIPIGIIDLNLGYTFPISWLSRETLDTTEAIYGRTDIPGQLIRYDKAVAAASSKEGFVARSHKDPLTADFLDYALFPSGGYNSTIHPLKGLSLKAALVQLGNDYPYMIYAGIEESENPFDTKELNRAYVQTYDIRKVGFRMEPFTTPRIPREWRKILGDEELPFALIMPPGSDLNTMGQHHREMRELQRLMAEDNTNVDVIMPGSEFTPYSAQPRDENILASRSLSWLEGTVYKKPGVFSTGPLFDRIEAVFSKATIYFKKGTAKGLKSTGDALDYFEAAGIEGDYSTVKAKIDGETIRVESDTVSRITRVRYNWNKNPNQQLVNMAGLPAVAFRSERAKYYWYVRNSESGLPMEYYTPANEWPKNDVTLVNGQLKTHGYGNYTGWIGPAGFRVGPFGPNMGVREVKADSPAEGKLLIEDIIYSANGKMLGDKAWEVMGAAISESETREANGKLLLGLRRDGKNLNIELTLEVMGTYSPTAPFDCPKTEKIITQLEEWVVSKGAKAGFLRNDALFMLATGNPELQGYVRRIVYNLIKDKDPNRTIDPFKAGRSWHNSSEAILLGEYYLATGDTNVLPHLKHACDRLAATQHKEGGWRHNFPGGDSYGLIPNAGIPGVMGMHYAKEAGLIINLASYELGINYFKKNRAETGYLIYGIGPLCERTTPIAFEPEVMMAGKMDSCNGGLSAAGILMRFAGKKRAAHLTSMISSYAWNNTFHGHGGNFWNNFWTPLGAYQNNRKAFLHFWKNYRWYRESNRMFDGSLIQDEAGLTGAACGIALVAPRERIQIVGAPISPFSTNASVELKPALKAYHDKDYARCQKLAKELIESNTVAQIDMPTLKYLARQVRDIQASIEADVFRMKKLLNEGQVKEAKSFLPGLTAIVPATDQRLSEIQSFLGSALTATPDTNGSKKEKIVAKLAPVKRTWVRLVSETIAENGKHKGPTVVTAPQKASIWKMRVLEDKRHASKNWASPKFNDSSWKETELPMSWRMYHTALFRTQFVVEDRDAYDGLRLHSWLFRQQGVEVYLNGNLIVKINNLEKKTGDVDAEIKASALKYLKDGKNTLAVTTRHNWRWGMLFMKVYNNGFDFNLDARMKTASALKPVKMKRRRNRGL
jgi:sialate O-acetylesterase